MKNLLRFFVVGALLGTLVGCAMEEVLETLFTPVALNLKGSVKHPERTRVNSDGFEAEDQVGVYVSNTGALSASGNIADNVCFTYEDGNLVPPEGCEIYWGSESIRLNVYAYYPYIEQIGNNKSVAVQVAENQQLDKAYYQSDLLVAKATDLAPQASPVELVFSHALSQISISLEGDEELAGSKTFVISGLKSNGWLNLEEGSVSVGSAEASIVPMATTATEFSAVVIPQSGYVSFRLEIGSEQFTYSTDVEYQAGFRYHYSLRVNLQEPQSMSIVSTIIAPWQDGESTEGEMSNLLTLTNDVLKAYLIEEGYDQNFDREISIAEAQEVDEINLANRGLSELNDLKCFPNLKFLQCGGNNLTSLDVSKNLQLINLECGQNNLTSLDLSQNLQLSSILCPQNKLASLILPQSELVYLDCSANSLTSLDVSKNTKLKQLNCLGNQLASLNLSNNAELEVLYCAGNQLVSLDLSNNIEVYLFECGMNLLTTLDVSMLPSLEEFGCSQNQLTELDLSNNPKLIGLWCYDNQLTTLDLSNNPLMETLDCCDNNITTLYLPEGVELAEFEKDETTLVEYK